MPRQVNARLVRVAGAGTADDWDRPAGAGVEKWAGALNAYYREKAERVVLAGAVNVLVRRTVWVDTPALDALGIELDTDDLIRVELEDGTIVEAAAKAVAASRLAGVPAAVQTTRIDLEDG